jgi:hypothetical protein
MSIPSWASTLPSGVVVVPPESKTSEASLKKFAFVKPLIGSFPLEKLIELNLSGRLGFINEYASQLVRNGYKHKYAIEVAKCMAMLYKAGLGPILAKIVVQKVNPVEVTRNAVAKMARTAAVNLLKTQMAKNGGDYSVIQNWLTSHQTAGGQCDASQAVRRFLYAQLNSPQTNDFRTVDGQILRGAGTLKERAPGAQDAKKERQDKQKKEKNDGINMLIQKPYYQTSLIFYKAYTAVGLLEAQYVRNQIIQTVSVDRGINVKPGKKEGVKHGIADSTAYGGLPTGRGSKHWIYQFAKVPICRVHAAYFLSPELCQDGAKAGQKISSNVSLETLLGEREFIVHLGGRQSGRLLESAVVGQPQPTVKPKAIAVVKAK